MRVREDKSHPNGYTTAKSELSVVMTNACRDASCDVAGGSFRCVSEYSPAGDKGVAFGGGREASLEATCS